MRNKYGAGCVQGPISYPLESDWSVQGVLASRLDEEKCHRSLVYLFLTAWYSV